MDINTIAYNAITYMICETDLSIVEICDYIGCTEKDLRELGILTEEY